MELKSTREDLVLPEKLENKEEKTWKELKDASRDFVKEIQEDFGFTDSQIINVYLHGSRVYGTHSPESDYGISLHLPTTKTLW